MGMKDWLKAQAAQQLHKTADSVARRLQTPQPPATPPNGEAHYHPGPTGPTPQTGPLGGPVGGWLANQATQQLHNAADSMMAPRVAPTGVRRPRYKLMPLGPELSRRGRNGRTRLLVLDSHQPNVARIVRKSPNYQRSRGIGFGAAAAWADAIPEPTKGHDPQALQLWVGGKPVGFFQDEWVAIAQRHIRTNRSKPMSVPAVLRVSPTLGTFVWVSSSIEDAQSFVEWLAREDAHWLK